MRDQPALDSSPNVKLVFLGESTVGKTSIISVAHGGTLNAESSATVGACFHIKKLVVEDTEVKLHIWDTAGQERFRALAPMYYRDAHFALLIYAIDNRDSFTEVSTWYKALTDECDEMPQIVIVGNKIDLVHNRAVAMEEGRSLASELDAMFFEVSAKADSGQIKIMLEEIALKALHNFRDYQNRLNLNGSAGGGGCSC
jgi:small GTP-binding protein